jgi:hypothetical protein
MIRYEIEPLLHEYWFDQPERVDERVPEVARVKIPVRNVYYLLLYAWNQVGEGEEEVAQEESRSYTCTNSSRTSSRRRSRGCSRAGWTGSTARWTR